MAWPEVRFSPGPSPLLRIAAILVALAGTAAACGEPDSAMPEPVPCPAPTPVPASGFSRRDPLGAFRQNAYQNINRLESLTLEFRQLYPNGRFHRGKFRADFARYVDDSVCIATALQALTLPSGMAPAEAAFDSALDGFIDHQRAGREAVRARNVSGYRDWNRGVDSQLVALRDSLTVAP